jgi:hypothetical protein
MLATTTDDPIRGGSHQRSVIQAEMRGREPLLPAAPLPATAYAVRPRAADTHDRVRADVIDTNGVVTLRHALRLHHIGIGRTHATMLIQDLNVRIIDAATGELRCFVRP